MLLGFVVGNLEGKHPSHPSYFFEYIMYDGFELVSFIVLGQEQLCHKKYDTRVNSKWIALE